MLFLSPDWPAPARVRAATTTRQGGVSQPPFDSFNLGSHVGDVPANVATNRQQLVETLSLPDEPRWLNQVHGTTVANLDIGSDGIPEADASITTIANTVCAVLTADCLPVLFYDQAGTQVAAAHAGWRGLAAGVLEATIASFAAPPEQIIAWLGPAIGPQAFEVGEEVRQAFCTQKNHSACGDAFVVSPSDDQKWVADIYQLARQRLAAVGVSAVYGGEHCAVTEADDFYSFRRDGETGRMASMVWIEAGA